MKNLSGIIKDLENNENVDAVILVGSMGSNNASHSSDIDLVIIVNDKIDTRVVYTFIEDTFADIFIYSRDFIINIANKEIIEGNSVEGFTADWLISGKIEFCKNKEIKNLLEEMQKTPPVVGVYSKIENEFIKINYNYIANKRYFDSAKIEYHEALELRLWYSMSEVISGCIFKLGIPWRGEKNALTIMQEKIPETYKKIKTYWSINSLSERFKIYESLVLDVLGDYRWNNDFMWVGDVNHKGLDFSSCTVDGILKSIND